MAYGMKVFHLITALELGGAEGVLYRLAVASREQVNHVIVSMTDEGDYGPLLRNLGITVHALQLPRGRLTLRGLYRLWSLMREAKPDVVQTWMYPADLAGSLVARLQGISPICWGVRNSNFKSCGRTAKLAGRLCAWVSGWAPTVIVSCSEHAARVHEKLGYPPEKFAIIPNGYDLSEFSAQPGARSALHEEWKFPLACR